MLDVNLLKDWRSFQLDKFKDRLATTNMYPCNFIFENVTYMQGTLSFVMNPEGEDSVELRYKEFLHITIAIGSIVGYSQEGLNISLSLLPHGRRVDMVFPNVDIHRVAFMNIQHFAREQVAEPTPPSSNSGSD